MGVVERHEIYSVLPSGHIRLLWVLPESDKDEIHCSLEIADLDADRNTDQNKDLMFDCLSYTWMNPLGLPESSPEFQREKDNPFCQRIACNGSPLRVSRNLFECLQFFRHKGLHVRSAADEDASCTLPIWIDAVCIDQNNEEEKSKQIPMMRYIYARARQVLIWLGPEDEHIYRAASVIDQLASVAKGIRGLEYYDLTTEDPCPKLGITPPISLEEWCSYASLLQRAWFSRVWVAQETYFAKSIVVFCGKKEILWENLERSASVLQETGLAEALERMVQSNIDLEITVNASLTDSPNLGRNAVPINSFSPLKSSLNNQLILTVFGGQGEKVPFSLDSLLAYTGYLEAGQPADKVFGLYGIWQNSKIGQEFEYLVPVSYKISVSDVFTNATYAAIRESKDLNILRLVRPTASELPSWVPDYTRWPQLYNITIRRRLSITETNKNGETVSRSDAGGGEAHTNWRADGGQSWGNSEDIPRLGKQSRRLAVKGILFEPIACIGPYYRQIDSGHELHLLLGHLGKHPSSSSPYGLSSSMAWLQTLLAGKYRGQSASCEAIQAFHDLVAVFVRELEEAKQYSKLVDLPEASELERLHEQTKDAIDDLSARPSNQGIIPTWETVERLIEISCYTPDSTENDRAEPDTMMDEKSRMDSDMDAIRQSFDRAYMGRRIFRTTGNHWGISSESLEEGDQVFVLSGADTPYVLRRVNWRWKVIGEAYVHGIMYGEAADGLFQDLN
ncbi:heterokaryon incompatibility protein-domain-containing protein [Nemania sp. FL0031]|nr:heterokaryon incompatibility protein-domain-containing protein [Nemania sp. FL0031]